VARTRKVSLVRNQKEGEGVAMLKGISPVLGAEALWVLAAMGHGDDLALVDRNFPAAEVAARTVTGRLVRLDGVDATAAARAIFRLLPIDDFVDDPIRRMEVVGEPDTMLEVHREVLAEARAAEGRDVPLASIERHAFYAAARQAFAVIQTTESQPYGCFLIRKGVVFD